MTSDSQYQDGVPVGSADVDADARRTGADEPDEWPGDAEDRPLVDADTGGGTDDGTPVGRAHAEADRIRSGGDDDRL